MKLTADRLREVLNYNPETGIFSWRINRGSRARPGAQAGTLDKSTGYFRICIDDTVYYSHRLAWLFMTGEWPTDQVDHRDANRANNAWSNLRPATKSQNNRNVRVSRNNKSGLKGVSPAGPGRWNATIYAGRKYHLGYFPTPEQAHAAYCEAAEHLHGEFARFG